MDVAHHTLELLERVQADLADVKREQLSQGVRLAAIEQHLAANQSRSPASAATWRR